jgi:predicted ATPase
VAEQVSVLCDRFEAAWVAGQRPRIEDFWDSTREMQPGALLSELVLLDIHYRRLAKETPRAEDYLPRFPMLDLAWLSAVIAAPAAEGTGSSPPVRDTDCKSEPEPRSDRPEPADGRNEPTGPGDPLQSPGRFAAGQMVAHYEIREELGGGGMGVVYKAIDTRLGRRVALKFVHSEYAKDRRALGRFLREARTASGLNHPHICTIHALEEYEGWPFLVMELIEGRTIRRVAKEGLSLEAVVRLAGQVAKALAAAHAAGIVHRDIKPENLMVREDGFVKVLDFGLARLLPAGPAPMVAENGAGTDPGTILGTARYMAPEQARGEPADSAADVFALGVVLYELASGRHPFAGDSQLAVLHAIMAQPVLPPSRLNSAIPATLEALLEQMLAKEPRLRPRAAEVDRILADLADKSAAPQDASRLLVPGARHTVGRHAERAELRAGFESAAAGRGLVICLAGEPGIGKTTLVEDFCQELAAGGGRFTVARGRCSERLAGSDAYLPFLEALESLLHSGVQETATRLLKVLAPTWFVLIAPLSDEGSSERLLAEARTASSERMKRELLAFLQELGRIEPLLLFLDDLHWADLSTVDLLAYLGSRCAGLRLLIVLTYRSAELMLNKHPFLPVKLELQSRGVCRELGVEFLTREDIENYLALQFSGHRFPAEFAPLIHAQTEGNPLFMVDLLHYLQTRKVILQETGPWTLAQAVPDIQRELPESVRSMIQRKIEQLGEAERRLLVAASVQGYEFDSAVLAKALSLDAAEVEDRLEGLERTHAFIRFVREQEFPDRTLSLRYRFVHVLYQNVLYGSLRATRKASLSANVANALVEFHGKETGAVASELALLFEAARDWTQASDFFLLAAENAARVFAHREAVGLARRGLELLKGLPDTPERARRELLLLTALGQPLMATKGYGSVEAEESYTRARELCRQLGESPQFLPILIGLWSFHLVRAELAIARDFGEELLRLAQRSQDTPLLVEAHWRLGIAFLHMGELRPAQEHFAKGIALYDPARDCGRILHDAGVSCRCFAAWVLWLLGYPDQSLQQSEDSLALARNLDHPPSLAFALFFAAFVRQHRRDVPGTRAYAEAAMMLSQERGLLQTLAWATMMRGWAVAEQGQVDEGIAQMRDCLAGQQAIGSQIARPHFLALLAEAYGKAGRAAEGLTVLEEALAAVEQTGERYYEAELHRLKGELRLLRSADRETPKLLGAEQPVWTKAESCFRESFAIARKQGAQSFALRAAVSWRQVGLKQGDRENVRGLLAEVYGEFTEGFDAPDLIAAKALLDLPS